MSRSVAFCRIGRRGNGWRRAKCISRGGVFWGVLGWEVGEAPMRGVRRIEMTAVRMLSLLKDRAAVRRWDLARAAKAEKVGFWAGIEGYFFIFGGGGRCARVSWSDRHASKQRPMSLLVLPTMRAAVYGKAAHPLSGGSRSGGEDAPACGEDRRPDRQRSACETSVRSRSRQPHPTPAFEGHAQ